MRLSEESRYKALLGVSTAIASQPSLQVVLHSISRLLSTAVHFNTISLLLVDQEQETAQIYALEADHQLEGFEVGDRVPYKGTAVADVLATQRPLYIPDNRAEMMKIPQFAHRARFESLQSSYVFPVTGPRSELGVLIFGTISPQEYSAADVELMESVTAHISVALESALALESAEGYRRELERERDRLRLLLEINNHIISHLDVSELFRAASISIRTFFNNAFAGFWLFEENSNELRGITLDFPGSRGYVENIPVPKLSELDLELLRARTPAVFGIDEIALFRPAAVAEALRAESIVSLVGVPLMGLTRPLGMLSLGSRRENAFAPADLELLTQVGSQIALALENALAYGRLDVSRNRLEDERLYLESEIQSEYNYEDIIGKSAALRKVLDEVSVVAPTDSTVLLIGETGTGKELIARAIHNRSTRNAHTFVRLNCAAIPQGLMESELFGHEKGAFTGALVQKRGRIELAHEGSLFLDEIGDVLPELQPKLLRVLQEREFERLGSNRTMRVDVRLIAATNRDLPAMVQKGEFREDLFYRLNVFPIHIPPLRERKDDIPLLVHYFVGQLARKMRKRIRVIPRGVLEIMVDWPWPGNVRELQNFIERSVILSNDEVLAAPISELRQPKATGALSRPKIPSTDREAILRALQESEGRIAGAGGAAERLGLKRTTLLKRMARLNISRSSAL